jgi:DNA-binding HxlR family transcriptional regulator
VKRSSVGHFNCSIARGLDIIGEWWTLLVLRDVFMGVRRFEAIQADLGIARNVLSDRLTTLVDHGVLERRRYQEHPERHEYVLTEMGRDLAPVLIELMRWGDRWLSPDGAPMVLLHRACGQPVVWGEACEHCGVAVEASSLRMVKGPGWRPPASAMTRGEGGERRVTSDTVA